LLNYTDIYFRKKGDKSMKNKIMEIENIYKSFNGFKAVDDISFEVYEGEILGLLGPNGAGKTTVIRMIMGIFKPDSGKIKFEKELNLDKRKIGYLPEERGLYESSGVLDTILYFADLKGMDMLQAKKRAINLLELMDLKDFTFNKIENLSKGMQQKVQFIISIIHKPKLIVLDEVFSGLDPVNQDLFKKIILDLSQEGATILLSSHRMNMVEELCDRIFMINRGKMVLYGEIDKIKDGFGERKVKIKTKSDTKFLENLTLVKNLYKENRVVSFNIPFEISPGDFMRELPENIEVDELSILKPPLHEIFVEEIRKGDINEG
jgi:ABC-2 type transport system ATP-binding protein